LYQLSDSLHELQTSLKKNVNPYLDRVGRISRNILLDVEDAILKTKEQLDSDANNLRNALNEIEIEKARRDLEDAQDGWLRVTGSAM
jgi:hypothetical protein